MERIDRSTRIETISDGQVYALPRFFGFRLGNLLFDVAIMQRLVIKVPSRVSPDPLSDGGWNDYLKHVRDGSTDAGFERPPDAEECWANRSQLLARYPELQQLHGQWPEEFLHFLAVHKLQHDRLRRAVSVPDSRFIVATRSMYFGLSKENRPAVVQELVWGAGFWNMLDHASGQLQPRWQEYSPNIRYQLGLLLRSGVDVDWNPKNFIFDPRGGDVWYVDAKCGAMMPVSSNKQNLSALRRNLNF
jgi:hypothetical protein